MNQKKIALALLGLVAELLRKENDCDCVATSSPVPPMQKKPCNCGCAAHTPTPDFNREPDGVQIIVDRPRMEDYYSRQKWAQDMANYRGLIDQAKKCDGIKTRKPDFIPDEVHNNRRDWYDDNGQGFNDIKNIVNRNQSRRLGETSAPWPPVFDFINSLAGFNPNEPWF